MAGRSSGLIERLHTVFRLNMIVVQRTGAYRILEDPLSSGFIYLLFAVSLFHARLIFFVSLLGEFFIQAYPSLSSVASRL